MIDCQQLWGGAQLLLFLHRSDCNFIVKCLRNRSDQGSWQSSQFRQLKQSRPIVPKALYQYDEDNEVPNQKHITVMFLRKIGQRL